MIITLLLEVEIICLKRERPSLSPTTHWVVLRRHPAELLLQRRKDVKILANEFLKLVPELEPLFIGVDVFDGANAHKSNTRALRQANHHLEQGGALLVFPAAKSHNWSIAKHFASRIKSGAARSARSSRKTKH